MRQEGFTLSASPLNSHDGSAAKKVPRAQESHQLRRLGVVELSLKHYWTSFVF